MSKKKDTEHIDHKKKQTSHINKRLYQVAWMVIGGLSIGFLMINIVASQMVNNLYLKFVQEDESAQVAFFKIARDLPEFQAVMPYTAGTYRELSEEINQDNVTRLEQIKELELLLEQNPNARDVLYAISQLYAQSGDDDKAAEYLNRAQDIDPSLP